MSYMVKIYYKKDVTYTSISSKSFIRKYKLICFSKKTVKTENIIRIPSISNDFSFVLVLS